VTAQLTSRETNTSYVALVGNDEPVAVTRFTIGFGQGGRSVLDIVYPVAALRAVEGQLSAGASDREGVNASDWSERLAAALGEVRIEARSVLSRPSLSVSELLRLSVGDVIPISMPAVVPLLVEGRQIAIGKLGEQDGRAAIRIERIEFRSSVE
jgi:flagellar motor switch protein FliM